MTPPSKDQLHYRQAALNMALSTHDGQGNADRVVQSAQKYFDFMSNSATEKSAEPMLVGFTAPSGLPDDWTGPLPLPATTMDSVMAAELETVDLQHIRRRLLFELDAVSSVLKTRGVVPV